MVRCPECDSGDVQSEWDDRHSQEDYVVIRWWCNNCGCEWNVVESVEISKHGSVWEQEHKVK